MVLIANAFIKAVEVAGNGQELSSAWWLQD